MAMVAEDLKIAIQDAFATPPEDATEAQSTFGNAVKDYLEENCEITYAWVGANPSSTPDPTVTFTAKPTWTTFSLAPFADFTLWMAGLSAIVATALLTPDDTTFLLTGMTFGLVPIVGIQSGLDDPDEAMLDVCEQIIDGVKLMINLVPSVGSHSAFTGTATMTSIA